MIVFSSSVSDDFVSFDLFPIYASLELSPARRLMMQRLPSQIPAPDDFTVANPSHVAALALLGVFIFPTEKAAVRRAVADEGSFTKLVKDRVTEMRQDIEAVAPLFLRMGLAVSESPEPRTSNKEYSPLGIPRKLLPPSVQAAFDRLDREAAYLKMKLEARMNRCALEYGYGDIGKLLRFVDKVNEVLTGWGLADYPTISKPDRFITYLLSATHATNFYKKALEDLQAHRDVLRRRTAGEIWLFVRSRAGELDDVAFEVEDDELTVICRVGQTMHRERLVDRHVDARTIVSDDVVI